MLHKLRRRDSKLHLGPQQPVQQVEFGKAGRDRGGTCRWRGFLEMGERGAMLAIRHVHHVLDRIAQVLRQPGCDAVEQVLHRMGRHRGDQALQGADSRQHDPRRAQQVLGQGQQRSERHALGRTFLQLGAKPLLGGLIELVPAQMLADAVQLRALCRRSLRVRQEQQRVEAELGSPRRLLNTAR